MEKESDVFLKITIFEDFNVRSLILGFCNIEDELFIDVGPINEMSLSKEQAKRLFNFLKISLGEENAVKEGKVESSV